jgi:hypothetical protein
MHASLYWRTQHALHPVPSCSPTAGASDCRGEWGPHLTLTWAGSTALEYASSWWLMACRLLSNLWKSASAATEAPRAKTGTPLKKVSWPGAQVLRHTIETSCVDRGRRRVDRGPNPAPALLCSSCTCRVLPSS